MPQTGQGELRVSWDQYHRHIEALALLVHRSSWQFDHILCLARGGLRPGDVLSRLFNVPLAILSTSSYREEAGSQQGELAIARHVTMPAGSLAGRVLLVDDLVDSGVTLEKVQHHLREAFPDVTEVRSAVIWYKARSVMRPDYFVEHLEGNPWIMQPFEVYEQMGIAGLAGQGTPGQAA